MQAERLFASWLRTRRAMRQPAARLAALREKQWLALQPALARTPAIARFAGKPLGEFPIADIGDLRKDYGAWNSLGLSDSRLRALADTAEEDARQGALSVGWSSGTGGSTRGLFVADATERADYIGQSLARLLPFRALLRRQRLALHLRASNALYSDASHDRFGFAHFPLAASTEETMAALAHYRPTILVAPPHRLLDFVQEGLSLPSLEHLFCGSEPISNAERALIEDAFGLAPRSIYQATEGFLGAECREGRLHLNDHALEMELEPIAGTGGFRPIITDLRRTSQPVVRLRGDDYLELESGVCPCGYAGRVIRPVEGRVQDLWHFGGRCITPPEVVAAVETELGGSWRWQAVKSPQWINLHLPPDCPLELAERAVAALARLVPGSAVLRRDIAPRIEAKRRKVAWSDA